MTGKFLYWGAMAVFLVGSVIALYNNETGWRTKVHQAGSAVKVSDESGHGSGVHFGNGLILTANHVAADEKEKDIKLDNGVVLKGDVVWGNEDYDLAAVLLRPNRERIATSKLLCRYPAVGTEIHAIGNPLGEEFVSVYGHVATVVAEHGPWRAAYIADMTLAPGMSGGPVFDKSGIVVGIMTGVVTMPLLSKRRIPAEQMVPLAYVVPSASACLLMGH